MNILTAVPVKYDAEWTRHTLKRIAGSLLIIDDNASPEVRAVCEEYGRANIIHHTENQYVNPSWNEAMKFFLDFPKWEWLCILNSDLVMMDRWEMFCEEHMEEKVIMLPFQVEGQGFDVGPAGSNTGSYIPIEGGYPGIFLLMDRKMVEIVYPIPDSLKLWFGDNWIFGKLRKAGYRQRVYNELMCKHGVSKSSGNIEGGGTMIEEDKKAWFEIRIREGLTD